MTSDDRLSRAADRLRQAHGRVLGAIESTGVQLQHQHEDQRRQIDADYQRRIATARNHSAQQAIEHTGEATCAADEMTTPAEVPLGVAEFVDLGAIVVSGSDLGINEDVDLPFVLPFLGQSHVVVIGKAEDETKTVIHQLVLQALDNTAAGQLDVLFYDPQLRGWLAPFAGLKSASPDAIQVITRPRELEEQIDRLINDVQRINDTMQGGPSLVEYRRDVGFPVERLQLVILADYAAHVEPSLHQRVQTLARVAPAAGITLVLTRDPAAEPTDSGSVMTQKIDPASIEDLGEVLDFRSGLSWARVPEATIRIRPSTEREVASRVQAIAARASETAGASIDFSEVEDLTKRWHESSADRISFSIGQRGHERAEITLGDSQEQRHNVLITGAVGQGKSNLLKVIIHSIGQRYSPDEVQLYLLDLKDGVTLYPFAATPDSPDYLPHARVLGLESDREFGLAVLRHLDQERARRSSVIKPYGDNIARYRVAVPEATMPRVVLIIDEFQRLFEPGDDPIAKEAAQLLESVARLGRASGIHTLLASQTISGIQTLLARHNGIYGQFPIRLALKNSPTESVATLTAGNDAAARLRSRGEVIVNLEYGAVESNRTATVAVAEEATLEGLRQDWWRSARSSFPPPIVFDGAAPLRPAETIDQLKQLRRGAGQESPLRRACLGRQITVDSAPALVPFGPEPGRNLAVLGAGEKSHALTSDAAQSAALNNGVGVLQGAALSLAMQHPEGDARFISIEAMDASTATDNNHPAWHQLMTSLGFPVEVIERGGAPTFLADLALSLPQTEPGGTPTYVLGFGMDRLGRLDTHDGGINPAKPVDHLRQVLRDGPTRSHHFLGWWASAATYSAHIGFDGGDLVDILLFLRADQQAVQGILGPFVNWSVRDNRGLWADRTQLPQPVPIVPYAPITDRDRTQFQNAEWDA